MNLQELLVARLDAPIVIRPIPCMTQGELESHLDLAAGGGVIGVTSIAL
jgi:hypothetical protein